jgi:hypothetical protein
MTSESIPSFVPDGGQGRCVPPSSGETAEILAGLANI